MAAWAPDGDLLQSGRWHLARITAVRPREGHDARYNVRFEQDGAVTEDLDARWIQPITTVVDSRAEDHALTAARREMAVALRRLRLYLTSLLGELRPGSFVWVPAVAATGVHMWRRRVRHVTLDMFPAGHVLLEDGDALTWRTGYFEDDTADDLAKSVVLLPSPAGTPREKSLLMVLHADGVLPLFFHDAPIPAPAEEGLPDPTISHVTQTLPENQTNLDRPHFHPKTPAQINQSAQINEPAHVAPYLLGEY
jgi:hypothetical protein